MVIESDMVCRSADGREIAEGTAQIAVGKRSEKSEREKERKKKKKWMRKWIIKK